jgi:hypothetical protein
MAWGLMGWVGKVGEVNGWMMTSQDMIDAWLILT